MKRKAVILRARAARDVDAAIDYYIEEAGQAVALRFVDALEAAYRQIGEHPVSGSPRYVHELVLPGLCCLHLKGFPWLVFYVAKEDHVDVWRTLHAQRDIPALKNDHET